MANFSFRQGFTYVAGINKPSIVSRNAMIGGVTDLGFRVLFAEECQKMPRFPFAVPGNCGDDWDWVGYAERTGPSQMVDVPGRVKWIQEIPKPQPPPPPGQPEPPPAPMPPSWSNPDPLEAGMPAIVGGTKTSTMPGSGSIWLPILLGSAGGYLLVRWLR